MDLGRVLSSLLYDVSPYFLSGNSLDKDRDFGHVFRKAVADCGLKGVYTLKGSEYGGSQANVPVVYVCEADSEQKARDIHRKVWNQNAVPFLLVVSPSWVRLYPGFQYDRDVSRDPLEGALKVVTDFNQISAALGPLRAESVDSGLVWKQMRNAISTEGRVDWQLLDNLRDLDKWLEHDGVRDRGLAHAMIGKFVYLYYLRRRGILSDSRLAQWGVSPDDVFGHSGKLDSFVKLVRELDEWLNGGVFPLSAEQIAEFGAERIRQVASVFSGQQVATGQLPLFDIYDFSFIPIETLSIIYEQFLHDRTDPSGVSEGEAKSAYYTPLPVVNYMLDKLDSRKPLQQGMRVLDCSCGSGAFLVQCYRKLIERRLHEVGGLLRPAELGRLLTEHIFGVDIDEDACQIAELSLVLTLLEYVDPPDLTETKFKLPALRGQNIFHGNAFDDSLPWYQEGRKRGYQWIVGNPPWKELKPKKLDQAGEIAWAWMQKVREHCPIGGNQIAEAFLWRASEVLDVQGEATLLVPAMTLFKYESTAFRQKFLGRYALWSVANFANLSNVLFGGRATLPAAALFYSLPTDAEGTTHSDPIEIYSPFLANQPVSHSLGGRGGKQTWALVVNTSEVRFIERREISQGQVMPWKIAMWGSPIDTKLLRIITDRVTTGKLASLGQLEESNLLVISEGPAFVDEERADPETAEYHPEIENERTIISDKVKGHRLLYRFPEKVYGQLGPANTYLSKRAGVKRKLSVCYPPHVLVGASRNFSIYSEEIIVVPARQIGITSPDGNRDLLKAIALYLNSDFASYHQFLTSTEAGIQKTRGTIDSLRSLPLPFAVSTDFTQWAELYSRILRQRADQDDFDTPDLVEALNDLTFASLNLSSRARAAVHDLVRVRFGLKRGKMGSSAIDPPAEDELKRYAETLRDELDSFVGTSDPTRHQVAILQGNGEGLVAVSLVPASKEHEPVTIQSASDLASGELQEARSHLLEKRAQWLYFNRNLRVYEHSRTYFLKPLQRLHWTVTQAIQDAGEVIADSLQTAPIAPLQVVS